MEKIATTFAEVYKFRFGMLVLTDDGEEGSLTSISFAPKEGTVEYIGIKFRVGVFALGKEYAVPLDAVRHANEHEIRLAATRAEVEQQFAAKPAAPTFSSGTTVLTSERRIGRLAQLTINRDTHELRHIVVERGAGQEYVLSAQYITALEGRRITTNLTPDAARSLTPYVPDEELRDEIHHAIENYNRLRVDLPGIAVRVIDGVVWLQGHVSSEINLHQIQDQLIGIRGISDIYNDLIADNDLAAAVSHALARDPRTSQGHIGVYPSLGNVRLSGRVRTPEMRAAAIEIARQVPGVDGVTNELVVDPKASVLPVLASITGDEDRVPGGR